VTPEKGTEANYSGLPSDDDFNFGYRDTFVPRVGVEYTVFEIIDLRAGYAYRGASLALPSLERSNLLDNDVHRFSLGIGAHSISLQDVPLSADLYGTVDYMPVATVTKTTGTFQNYRFGGVVWTTGLSLTAGF
jgi:long-subunit fatty acid transport protein